MRVNRIADVESWQSLRHEWNALAQTPCETWDWLRAWWEYYGDEQNLYILTVRDGEELCGIVPWYRRTSMIRGKVLTQLGSGRVCSDYVSLLLSPGKRKATIGAIGQWLQDHSQAGDDEWDVIALEAVEDDNAKVADVTTTMHSIGNQIHREQTIGCWRLAVPASWEEYMAARSKRRRRTFRYLARTFLDSGRAELSICRHQDALRERMHTLVRLHQARRRDVQRDGDCFDSEQFTEFILDVADRFYQRGELMSAQLEVDGTPVAGSVGFVANNIHYMYQTGMVASQTVKHPGWLMNLAHIRYAMRRGWQAIDLMRGNEEYKASLGCREIPMSNTFIVRDRLKSQLRFKAWLKARAAKRFELSSILLASDSGILPEFDLGASTNLPPIQK